MRPVLLTSLHSSNFRMDKLRTAKRDLQHIPETEDEMQTNPIPHFALIPFLNTIQKYRSERSPHYMKAQQK